MISYRIYQIPKRSGGFRTIFEPNPELKQRQKEILELLKKETEKILPTFAKGFIPGLGIEDNARIHAKKKYILNIDIKDFFPNCTIERIPKNIELLLKQLEIKEEEIFIKYNGKTFLPQGAPTSPYLSNFWLENADYEIYSVLKRQISDDINYTRYADDITISSNSKAIFSPTAILIIENILKKYGFEINTKKTKKMTPGTRKEVTGLVVNSGRPTVSKKFRLKVRAAVHNFLTKPEERTRENFFKILGWLGFVSISHPQWSKEQSKKVVEMAIKENIIKRTINKRKDDIPF